MGITTTFHIDKAKTIYLAGHTGLIGSAILRRFAAAGFKHVIYKPHRDLDLTRQSDVEAFFEKEKPEYVILAAARVGGILANITCGAEFVYDNLMIQSNIIHSAYLNKVKKLLFFGSACAYPRDCAQPMREEHLLTGVLEPTNEPYAAAKIAGIKMCQAYNRQYGTNFICAFLTNAYGPNDNFSLRDSHVIPSLIKKFHDAKAKGERDVVIWGTGAAIREFIYADDVAEAALFLMSHYNETAFLNVGSGMEICIKDLALLIKDIVGFQGGLVFDTERPDGAPKKALAGERMRNLGWKAKTSMREGIRETYRWFLSHKEEIDRREIPPKEWSSKS
ncbi:MAG: GDP-L-fucose synthase [Candidatus Vecturithrix sp.]|jgi:GDP-L-fucose synthase|nr:GDP-L-fucose synthase [Candidatus Vecturithrix sp.]